MKLVFVALLLASPAHAICIPMPKIDWQDQLIEQIAVMACEVSEQATKIDNLNRTVAAQDEAIDIQTRMIEGLSDEIVKLRSEIEARDGG